MHKTLLSFLFLGCLTACSTNNVKTDNSLEHFFKENNATGTFALLDNGTGQFTIYNLKRYRDSSYSPGSTFDIVVALVGLQTGKIDGEAMPVIKKTPLGSDSTLTMREAFKKSENFYFPAILNFIGKDDMQHWLDSLSYGTKKIMTSADSFWFDNSLRIKPDEQLGLIKRLYFKQLPFYQPYQEIVRRDLPAETNSNYKLSYKSAALRTADKQMGWTMGWIEENNHPYFFVLNFDIPGTDADIPATSLNMLKGILKQLGFLQGRM